MHQLAFALAAMLLLACSAASAFEVPLKFTKADKRGDTTLLVSSIKLANYDMLAPGAKPPEFWIDFTTSQSKGLTQLREQLTTRTEAAGRPCLKTERFVLLTVDDPTSQTSKGELFVLVEYLDAGPADNSLVITYDSQEKDVFRAGARTDTAAITNTGAWKKEQFRLPNAFFGTRRQGPGDFTLFVQQASRFTPYTSQSAQPMGKPPGSGWKLPTLVGSDPFYTFVMLADKPRLMAVDRQSSDSAYYDRIYFDANGNRDLLDDAIVTGTVSASGQSTSTAFPTVDLNVTVDGKPLPYSLGFSLRASTYYMSFDGGPAPQTQTDVTLQSNCTYEGEFDLDGKHYRLCLTDNNVNGRFDDSVIQPRSISLSRTWGEVGQTPYLSISGDGLGMTSGRDFSYEEQMHLGDMLWLGNKAYELKMDMAGQKLVMTPSSQTLYPVRIPAATRVLELAALNGAHGIAVIDPASEEIRVPEGLYSAVKYAIAKTDQEGSLWQASASSLSFDGFLFATSAEEPARLVYGEPFQAVINASNPFGRNASRRVVFVNGVPTPQTSSTISQLSFSLRGAGGEAISSLTCLDKSKTKQGRSASRPDRAAEPTWMVMKPDGEMVAKGKFEYG